MELVERFRNRMWPNFMRTELVKNKIELHDKSISVMHKITRGCVTNSGMRHKLLALRFTCINLEYLKALANVI